MKIDSKIQSQLKGYLQRILHMGLPSLIALSMSGENLAAELTSNCPVIGGTGEALGSRVTQLGLPGVTNNLHDFVVSGSEAGIVEIHSSTYPKVRLPVNAADKFGGAVAGIGDVNNDGFGDFAVSAVGGANNYVDVYSGNITNGTSELLFHTTPPSNWPSYSGYGYSIAAVGDMNHDGYPDYAIGGPGIGNTSWSGGFVIRSGMTGGILANIIGNPVLGNANLGIYLSGVGDLNNDGTDDIAVGAIFYDGHRGFLRIYSGYDVIYPGGPDVIWQHFGDNTGDFFGVALGAADYDNDGRNDVVFAGAPQYGVASGYVKVLNATNGNQIAVLQKPQPFRTPNDYFGARGAVGDYDGDGQPDIVITAPTLTGEGSIWSFSGSSLTPMFNLSGPQGERFGTSIAALWTNALGHAQFVVSSEWYNGDQGKACVYTYGVEPVTPVINWPQPSDITFGTPLSSTQLNAIAVHPVTGDEIQGTSSYDPGAGTVLDVGDDIELSLHFTPNDEESFTEAFATRLINVVKAPTSISLQSSPNPTVIGQTIVLTANILPSTATGSVSFFDGGNLLGTASIDAGVASLSIGSLPIGVYPVLATYAGDTRHEPGTATVTHTVKQTITVVTRLIDSHGNPILGAKMQYYKAGWQDIGITDGTGSVSAELLPGVYNFSVDFAYGRVTRVQDINQNSDVTFQTIRVSTQLIDSLGNPLSGAKTQYYGNAWRDIGFTDVNGIAEIELLSGNYNFSVDYAFSRATRVQNIGLDSGVVFQTIRVISGLFDSFGNPIGGAKTQYYAGGWHDIGFTDPSGVVGIELLGNSYNFSVDYAFGRSTKVQNISLDAGVNFQTTRVVTRLVTSLGNPLQGAKTQYYSGGWRDIGYTLADGTIAIELLGSTYNFSVDYGFSRITKIQNIAADSNVVFQTTRVVTQLIDSSGNPIAGASTQYYANGWHDIGITGLDGVAAIELLPNSYNFGIDYAYGRNTRVQNVNVGSSVVFQTGRVHSISGNCTQYYGSGWRSFSNDMELLPATWNFRFNDGTPNSTYSVVAGSVSSIH